MEITDLDSLTREPLQNNLYDLFIKTYNEDSAGSAPFSTYRVKEHQTMRIDDICNDIYGNVDNVDFLLNYNNIDNPLNIKSGDTIRYVPLEILDSFRSEEPSQVAAKKRFTNPSKATQKDPTRKDFLEQGFSLPPNFLEEPQASVRMDGNTLTIGG